MPSGPSTSATPSRSLPSSLDGPLTPRSPRSSQRRPSPKRSRGGGGSRNEVPPERVGCTPPGANTRGDDGMNTGIEFLEQLGADLVALAERESHHGPARRRRRPSVKFVAAGSAAVLVVAGLVGYFVPRLVPDRHVMQARQLP